MVSYVSSLIDFLIVSAILTLNTAESIIIQKEFLRSRTHLKYKVFYLLLVIVKSMFSLIINDTTVFG